MSALLTKVSAHFQITIDYDWNFKIYTPTEVVFHILQLISQEYTTISVEADTDRTLSNINISMGWRGINSYGKPCKCMVSISQNMGF